jgi:hypothetical protein
MTDYNLDDDLDDDPDDEDDFEDEDNDDFDEEDDADDEDVETWQVFKRNREIGLIFPLKPTLCLTSGTFVLDWQRFQLS